MAVRSLSPQAAASGGRRTALSPAMALHSVRRSWYYHRHQVPPSDSKNDRAMAMLFRSHSLTSGVDEFATKNADALILIGRILLAWIFVGSAYGAMTNFSGSVGYFRSLHVPAPELFTTITVALEVLMSAGLILGIGTRCCAVLVFLFVLVATAIAHRYWEYPAGQQIGQYNNFLKNLDHGRRHVDLCHRRRPVLPRSEAGRIAALFVQLLAQPDIPAMTTYSDCVTSPSA